MHALSGFDEVTVYGPVPPFIVNVITLRFVLTTVIDGGVTDSATGAGGVTGGGVTITVSLPDTPVTVAVTVTDWPEAAAVAGAV